MPKSTIRKRVTRPLMLISAGVAALSYFGCEILAIGNPKMPPDMGVSDLATDDLTAPPDLKMPIGDGSGTD